MVAGGLLVMSYTTRLTCGTLVVICYEIFSRMSIGILTNRAVMKSVVCTARSAAV